MLAATSALTLALLAVPLLAEAAMVAAPPCHQAERTTEYTFNGAIDVTTHDANSFKTDKYGALFHADDPQHPERIPADAKNNVLLELVDADTNGVISGQMSPDTIDYEQVFEGRFFNVIQKGKWVHVRFVADFDLRDFADPSCLTRTEDFTIVRPQNGPGGGAISAVCNKGGSLCSDIEI